MKIKKLKLYKFRCFEGYELELAERFTLLIGDNGSGKTAILDALAISTNAFLHDITEIKIGDKRHLTFDDIRKSIITMGQTPIEEAEEIAEVHSNYVLNNQIIGWSESIEIQDNKPELNYFGNSYEDLSKLVDDLIKNRSDINSFFPVIAYYGTGRLWKITDSNLETLPPSSRLLGYENCLNSALGLERLLRWFKTQELAALQKQERRHVLEAVREAIISMIPDAQKVFWDIDLDELVIETVIQEKLHSMPFHLLSDGYRNMVGMVADIAYRMATLNPQLESEAIKQTEGIVLIDEIDLHLHPKWQGIVVERLLNTFPKVQFVASSHSPFIIQSLYHKKDCLLWDLDKNQALEIDSKSIEDIAEDQQGVEIPQQSRRFIEMEEAAENYYRVLKQLPAASEEEKHRLKQKLDELLMPYSDDPAYQAFLKMERLAVEGE
jgi:predicted ATP-binding protein involved in virulence